MKKRPQREACTKKSIRYPNEVIKEVEEVFWPAFLRDHPEADPSESAAYTALVRRGLKYPSTPIQLAACVLVPWDLRCFHHYVNVNQDVPALKKAMDSWEGMLWAADPDDNNIHANRALVDYTGLSAPQFRHHGWKESLHPDDADRVFEECMERFKTRQSFYLVYQLRRKSGGYGWIYDLAYPRFYPHENFAGYVGTMIEVPGPGAIVEILDDPKFRGLSPLTIIPKTSPYRQIKAS